MQNLKFRILWGFLGTLFFGQISAHGKNEEFDNWILKHRNQNTSLSNSSKIKLGDLGIFAECLLVQSFITNGFVPSQNNPLENLEQSHSVGQKQTGKNLYLKFPWEFLFFPLKINSQKITWELTGGLFDKSRIYLPLEETIHFLQALENSPCLQTEWAKTWVHRTPENLTLLAGGKIILAWGTPGFFAGTTQQKYDSNREKIHKSILNLFEATKQ